MVILSIIIFFNYYFAFAEFCNRLETKHAPFESRLCFGDFTRKLILTCVALQAITQIQAALRGQAVRNKYIEQLDKELEFTDRDDAVVALQSAMRAHLARKKHLGYSEEDEITSRDTRTRGR